MVQYFIRLDDLCPTSNLKKWMPFFTLCDQYNIKPIIAVVPENKDVKLIGNRIVEPAFWQIVRNLQQKGYIIGMHGYQHLYETSNSGLLKANNRSEFAGLPYDVQEEKITTAREIFFREGVKPAVFVAPAHTFDKNTLLAIKNATEINIISDGLLSYPYEHLGFKWIPVQLSEPIPKKHGTWTLNFHPETCKEEVFSGLIDFVSLHKKDFVSLASLNYLKFDWFSLLTEKYLIYYRLLKDRMNKKHESVHHT